MALRAPYRREMVFSASDLGSLGQRMWVHCLCARFGLIHIRCCQRMMRPVCSFHVWHCVPDFQVTQPECEERTPKIEPSCILFYFPKNSDHYKSLEFVDCCAVYLVTWAELASTRFHSTSTFGQVLRRPSKESHPPGPRELFPLFLTQSSVTSR